MAKLLGRWCSSGFGKVLSVIRPTFTVNAAYRLLIGTHRQKVALPFEAISLWPLKGFTCSRGTLMLEVVIGAAA